MNGWQAFGISLPFYHVQIIVFSRTRREVMTEIIDTKICKPPQSYGGDKEGWRHFRTSLLGYVSALSPELKGMMQVAAELARPISYAEFGLTEQQRRLSGSLYVIFTSVLQAKSTAMDTLCNVEEGNGLEVFRRLSRRLAGG